MAWWHVADVADPNRSTAAVAAARDRWGGIDVLVNCAGFGYTSAFLDFPDAEWRRVMGVNLNGAFMMAQRVARVMAANGGGSIVHVSSIAAYAADGDEGAYNASKAGLHGLNTTMARELARHGIRSNIVAPGYTATPLTRDFLGAKMFDYVMNDFDRIPQRRMATPEEIAAAILFLASDDASAINGCELIVDGGTTANSYVVETLPSGLADRGRLVISAVVTGAAMGIGEAIAQRLLEEGATVVAVDRNATRWLALPRNSVTGWCRWKATSRSGRPTSARRSWRRSTASSPGG